MLYEVVTVVDNGIIVTRRVVLVAVAYLEESNVAQIGAGIIGQVDKVATHLAKENGAVGDDLELVENTHH